MSTDIAQAQQMKQLLVGVFDRAATTYARICPLFFDVLARRLVEQAELEPGQSVLDVATGTGAVLLPAAERVGPAGRVVGIDLSEGMLARAAEQVQERALANVRFERMDAERLELDAASFDRVLCGWGLFLFPEPHRALAEFHRVLKPGGRLLVTTGGVRFEAASLWVLDVVEKHWPAQIPIPPRPALRFTRPGDLVDALAGAGFSSIRVVEGAFDFVFQSEDEWWAWLNSISARAYLDLIEKTRGPEGLKALKSELLARVRDTRRSDGIHLPTDQLTAIATRPS
jgi:O-methyltransferase/aklanonic acid methyltransferase